MDKKLDTTGNIEELSLSWAPRKGGKMLVEVFLKGNLIATVRAEGFGTASLADVIRSCWEDFDDPNGALAAVAAL